MFKTLLWGPQNWSIRSLGYRKQNWHFSLDARLAVSMEDFITSQSYNTNFDIVSNVTILLCRLTNAPLKRSPKQCPLCASVKRWSPPPSSASSWRLRTTAAPWCSASPLTATWPSTSANTWCRAWTRPCWGALPAMRRAPARQNRPRLGLISYVSWP